MAYIHCGCGFKKENIPDTHVGKKAKCPKCNESVKVKINSNPNSGITRSALDEIKAIQTLLEDSYQDAGDGRTIIREIVQNADDAGAKQLVFIVLDSGWPKASNSLLRGPSLLVSNDGSFRQRDQEAFHKAVGGSKAEDFGKIGRFGIGLKSVFHVCEAIVYLGAEDGSLRPGVLNPWAGTGPQGKDDPIHPDWDRLENNDIKLLYNLSNSLLEQFKDGLLQWIPLRLPEHLDRAEGEQYGIALKCPTSDEIAHWFKRPTSMALLLAQCGHLVSINAFRAKNPNEIKSREKLAHISRPDFQSCRWVGRYKDDAEINEPKPKCFNGQIKAGDKAWIVSGVEAVGSKTLRNLRNDQDWPKEQQWTDGKAVWIPKKAIAHAAITILRPENGSDGSDNAIIRWAVFLPLDDAQTPLQNLLAEVVCNGQPDAAAWEIILHGYFWPTHDRRSIPGVTKEEEVENVRTKWNKSLRDDLLLPLLPQALGDAFKDIPENVVVSLVKGVKESKIVRENIAAIIKRDMLLPVVVAGGIQFECHSVNNTKVFSIPNWSKAPETTREQFVEQIKKHGDDGIHFIDENLPRIGGEPSSWSSEWVERLLSCIPSEAFKTIQNLSWVENLLKHLLGKPAPSSDERSAKVADWLAKRIGQGAFSATGEEIWNAWRGIFDALPSEWVVPTFKGALRAVVKIAKEGLLGTGLIIAPLGHNAEKLTSASPDNDRLEKVLSTIGKWLNEETTSQDLLESRLMLAESLLTVRGPENLRDELRQLPLLRAWLLPEDKVKPWSVNDLRNCVHKHRVFSRPAGGEEDDAPEAPSDPKQAVIELSKAIGKPAWLVDASLASIIDVPVPTPSHLASAIIYFQETLTTEAGQRFGLVTRLAQSDPIDINIRNALTKLLSGRSLNNENEDERDLFYVRSEDAHNNENRRTLQILLMLTGECWRQIEAELVEPLPHSLVNSLQIKPIDPGVLQGILQKALHHGIWNDIQEDDAMHLLRRMYSPTGQDHERWRQMPLHRLANGERGKIGNGALLVQEDFELPEGLKTEVILLDPDQEVADLYASIPKLGEDSILIAMLKSSEPYKYFEKIIEYLKNGIAIPNNGEIMDSLRNKEWLPDCHKSSGIAPDNLLIFSNQMIEGLRPIAKNGVLGQKILIDQIDSELWAAYSDVIIEIIGNDSPSKMLSKLSQSIDPRLMDQVDGGSFVVGPNQQVIDEAFINYAFQSSLAEKHQGWSLVRTAATEVGLNNTIGFENLSDGAKSTVVKFAKSLCGTLPSLYQINILKTLSSGNPANGTPIGQLFIRLVKECVQTPTFFNEVLPEIDLPTQDGHWRSSREIARSASGVARKHRILQKFRSPLRLNAQDHLAGQVQQNEQIQGNTWDILEEYFEKWKDRLPDSAVGAFLSLLGDGTIINPNGETELIYRLSEKWLGEETNVDDIRAKLTEETDLIADIKVYADQNIIFGQTINALNLLSEPTDMEAGSDNDTIFAVDPISGPLSNGHRYWKVTLRDVGPQQRTANDLLSILGKSAEWWGVHALRLQLETVRSWWAKWGTSSQTQIAPVRASILAHLPLTLLQIDVRECNALGDALKEAQRAQRNREQTNTNAALVAERAALERLASLLCNTPVHQKFVWRRIQYLMTRYGYREDSVLLELIQNADDALSQAAEIQGTSLNPGALKVRIKMHQNDNFILDFIHYGRPVNETGGAAFPAGKKRQWDQDLYYMMLMNLSAKPGETTGQNVESATTGRFGLGFKSVHLVSERPSIVSGFLAFSIAGGLLPVEESLPDDIDALSIADGRRVTRIRLPLINTPGLIEKIFSRFKYARPLLPAFARQIQEVEVDGVNNYSGSTAFKPKKIEDAPGWSIASDPVELPGHGKWRLLRFRTSDANPQSGSEALVVGLKDDIPKKFPQEIPFLWNVTPTSEGWNCGYAVNGPFKIDPGRTHISLDDEETLEVINRLGEALGYGLVKLQDALVGGKGENVEGLPSSKKAPEFLASLWKVLSTGLDASDELRKKLLDRLQCHGRGISAWMAQRVVVATGLPKPFKSYLPPLNFNEKIEQSGGGLEKEYFCSAIDQIDDLSQIAKKHLVVSQETASQLRPLISNGKMKELRSSDLFRELLEKWNHFLKPEYLHSLRPLSDEKIWRLINGNEIHFNEIQAHSKDRTNIPLRQLLIPQNQHCDEKDSDFQDELLRSRFAPSKFILASEYIQGPEDVVMFRRLRGRHEVGPNDICLWYWDLSDDERRRDGLRYLLYGELQRKVLQRLISQQNRPNWLRNYDKVHSLLNKLNSSDSEVDQLLIAFFPKKFQKVFEIGDSGGTLSTPALNRFFKNLVDWWDDEQERKKVIESYEQNAWPSWLREADIAKSLHSGSVNHWLGLLVLGACRNLGWADNSHHRNFLQMLYEKGWWDVFKQPDRVAKWMELLKNWQDQAVSNMEYLRWMSLFPSIYQLSRYRDKYRTLLLSAGNRPPELYHLSCLLSPRSDDALTGAGQHFDAPPAPINMGLHWILRELVRYEIINEAHIFPDCWVPTKKLLDFLCKIGLNLSDNNLSNQEKAHAISKFISEKLPNNPNAPHLHKSFDIPLLYIRKHSNLQEELGLEA